MQEKLQKLLEQAYELCEDGNYVMALEYYDIALDIEPNNPNVMVDKGVTLQNLGRFFPLLCGICPFLNLTSQITYSRI